MEDHSAGLGRTSLRQKLWLQRFLWVFSRIKQLEVRVGAPSILSHLSLVSCYRYILETLSDLCHNVALCHNK